MHTDDKFVSPPSHAQADKSGPNQDKSLRDRVCLNPPSFQRDYHPPFQYPAVKPLGSELQVARDSQTQTVRVVQQILPKGNKYDISWNSRSEFPCMEIGTSRMLLKSPLVCMRANLTILRIGWESADGARLDRKVWADGAHWRRGQDGGTETS